MGSNRRILVVDDDPAILRALRRGLTLEGFEVAVAECGEAALKGAAGADAIVLDVSLPDLSGIEVCRTLQDEGVQVPILMLSALDEVADRVAGLAAGADDYLVKPFDLTELALRLRALLRRAAPAGGRLRVGALVVDPQARRAVLGGRELALTRREFDLLEVLAFNAGMVLSRSVLLERVWGYDFQVTDNAVDTFVGYLRRKLEAGGEPRMLHTVRGVGFVLRAPG
ncbi:two-component system, OmpR family, response regulator PrrA [Thermomonospora echinospora]|uniref:Two-component system, OmpR family, response regulator PrrA n=1 Tax=Thermomonospora echinospora TaxID=1992 RepID=A0A1H6CDS2_9ACTN|nr:response regulator transcription factor [Thermomonospora echinospora]SEG70785.1 two-component system, OmpR family, response regulator PrrA [Thermomonospora echinospora]